MLTVTTNSLVSSLIYVAISFDRNSAHYETMTQENDVIRSERR